MNQLDLVFSIVTIDPSWNFIKIKNGSENSEKYDNMYLITFFFLN